MTKVILLHDAFVNITASKDYRGHLLKNYAEDWYHEMARILNLHEKVQLYINRITEEKLLCLKAGKWMELFISFQADKIIAALKTACYMHLIQAQKKGRRLL